MELLKSLVDAINSNPIIFLGIFAISFFANIMQIYTFIADRKSLKEERAEKARLNKLIDTYEYILDLAKQNIKTEEQLTSVNDEITQKNNLIEGMEERITALQKAAQKQIISDALDRNISLLLQAFEDINKLRKDYEDLGDLPDIPLEQKKEIENQVSIAIKRPYEFPRSFIFKSILLVLFVFLLNWPADTFVLVVFLHIFLDTFFEAVAIFDGSDIQNWVRKNQNWIGLGSAIGAWLSLLSTLENFINLPVSVLAQISSGFDVILSIYGVRSINLLQPILNTIQNITSIIQGFEFPVSILIGWLHWKAIRNSITKKFEFLTRKALHKKSPKLTSNTIRVLVSKVNIKNTIALGKTLLWFFRRSFKKIIIFFL